MTEPTGNSTNRDGSAEDAIDAASRGVGLIPAFQPIVSLPDAAVVGFEALARWPDLQLKDPRAVFSHAEAEGRMGQLDRRCIEAALAEALSSSMSPNTLLCVNCEPSSTGVRYVAESVLARGHARFQLMFELTERHLFEHPQSLLRKISNLRADGFLIALDDVGAHPASLALLDIVCPDVVKLDLTLVQSQPDHSKAQTVAAVLAHHERTGATILAEGIETDEHLEQALALGATLGQGYKFGRPARIEQYPSAVPWSPAGQLPTPKSAASSPFQQVRRHTPLRTGGKPTLVALSRHIEHIAHHAPDPPVLLTALQSVRYFTRNTRRLYRNFAATSPLVAVFGKELPEQLGTGIRGVALDPDDPLCREWIVVALGPHTAAALIARETHTTSTTGAPEHDRRFDFLVTFDRRMVTAAARSLLDRAH